jgi:hypothetical protein
MDFYFMDLVVEELKDVPIKLEEYKVVELEHGGCHVFRWKIEYEREGDTIVFKPTEDDWKKIEEVMHRDDDSQPYSQYSVYFKDIFMFVPFYS